MSGEMLTQEGIDALMNESLPPSPTSFLSQQDKDVIGEVGNITMSQAATTLSALLNKSVMITTPKVSEVSFDEILKNSDVPKVATVIEFKEGLVGSNILMIKTTDAIVIADLMMGNSGEGVADKEFGELELSAVGEAMNQMIGSSTTAMATMLSRKVDIRPPVIKMWEKKKDVSFGAINGTDTMCSIEFQLTVEGLVDSKIMQLFPIETATEIIALVMEDKGTILPGRENIKRKPAVEMPEQMETLSSEVSESEKISIQRPAFQELDKQTLPTAPRNLDLIMDVPLDFSVVLGRSRKTIKDILGFGTGSVVELDTMTDEPLEIYVNGKLIAEGEVVVINESFGIQITNILSKEQRIQNLN